MQDNPIKPTLKAPGTKRLKLKYDELLSTFAFKFNLRRYNMDAGLSSTPVPTPSADGSGETGDNAPMDVDATPKPIPFNLLPGRGLHSSTVRLTVSAFYGIGGALRAYVGGVHQGDVHYGILGGI